MKKHTTLLITLSFLLSLFVWGCSTARVGPGPRVTTGQTGDDNVRISTNSMSLAEYLARVPGIYMDTRYGVRVRSGGPPLFIIDGADAGNSYSTVESLVNVNDIQSVEVLKSSSELAVYGQRGANGVIIIKTM